MTDRRRSPSFKFTLSAILGLALIPLAAVVAVALVSDANPEAAVAAEPSVEVQALPEVQQVVFGAVGQATPEDLAAACGPAGLDLVAREADRTISPLQQAALDALRPICEGQGTPLPDKPEPDPITRTVTVRTATSAPAPVAPAATTTDTVADTTVAQRHERRRHVDEDDDSYEDEGSESGDDDSKESQPPPLSAEQKYATVYARALGEIDDAVSAGGNSEKIDEARNKLREAESRADDGNYEEATVNAYEAIGKAREAVGEEEDDD